MDTFSFQFSSKNNHLNFRNLGRLAQQVSLRNSSSLCCGHVCRAQFVVSFRKAVLNVPYLIYRNMGRLAHR